jgi:hypothetical protein
VRGPLERRFQPVRALVGVRHYASSGTGLLVILPELATGVMIACYKRTCWYRSAGHNQESVQIDSLLTIPCRIDKSFTDQAPELGYEFYFGVFHFFPLVK